MIFVNSMGDLFHKQIPVEFTSRVFGATDEASWHTYQVLTKRSSRMRDFIRSRYGDSAAPPNIWFGARFERRTRYTEPTRRS
jgi:protein gp37